MSPRSSAQYEEIREERISLIAASALKLFAEKTYDNTSIRDIARAAGISKGLIYNYFESKEALLVSILNEGLDKILKSFDPNHDGVLESDEMEYFINKSFDMLKEFKEFWKLFFQISLQTSVVKHIEQKIEAIYKEMGALLIPYFASIGIKDPETEAIIFGAMMDGLSIDYILKPDLFPIEAVKKNIIQKYCSKQPKS